jgi:hypothetical protein
VTEIEEFPRYMASYVTGSADDKYVHAHSIKAKIGK